MKTENELCECGHIETAHHYRKGCIALKSIKGYFALICGCKKFTPKSENQTEKK